MIAQIYWTEPGGRGRGIINLGLCNGGPGRGGNHFGDRGKEENQMEREKGVEIFKLLEPLVG